MATKEIKQIPPSNSTTGLLLIAITVVLTVVLAVVFIVKYFTVGGPDWQLGLFLSVEFFLFALAILFYARFFLPYREVSEDREDELLW